MPVLPRHALALIRLLLAPMLSIAAAGSCSDSSTEPKQPGIRIVEGANATDTIFAEQTVLLTVEIGDSGGRSAPSGTVVHFESPLNGQDPEMYVGNPEQGAAAWPSVNVTTDGQGRARARIRFGGKAKETFVVITVPTLEYEDTAHYEVLAGNPYSVDLSPEDTAATISKTLIMRGVVLDSMSNPRNDAVTYEAVTSGSSINAQGEFTSSTPGRYFVRAFATQNQALRDTAWVSVVPPGTIAAIVYNRQDLTKNDLVTFQLDGSEFKTLMTFQDTGPAEPDPVWTADKDRILYTAWDQVQEISRIYTVDTAGNVEPLLVSRPATMDFHA
jgi:hypothetical protein